MLDRSQCHEEATCDEEPVGIPIAEVARFTGHNTRELTDLVRAGALEQVSGRRALSAHARELARADGESGG